MQIWRDGDADKLTQLVFCDISTPQAAPSKKAAKQLDNPLLHGLEEAIPLDEPEPAFTIYEDIRQKLIAQGMPADQIAFIHEANTEAVSYTHLSTADPKPVPLRSRTDPIYR